MDFKPSEKKKENIIVGTPPRPLSIAYFTAFLNTSLNLTARPPPVRIFTALVEPNIFTHSFVYHSALFVPHCFTFFNGNILFFFFLFSVQQTSKGVLKNCSQPKNSLVPDVLNRSCSSLHLFLFLAKSSCQQISFLNCMLLIFLCQDIFQTPCVKMF